MTDNQILNFFGTVVAYGGGSAAIAYLLFQFLGKAWIENKFAERLEQQRHLQALELQRLRVEIDSMLSGVIKIQEKEFEVLPEAWIKLDESYLHVAQLVSPNQEHKNLDQLSPDRLEEFLMETSFLESEKADIRNSARKNETYLNTRFWHQLNQVRKSVTDFHHYVERNSVFMPPEQKVDFVEVSNKLWLIMNRQNASRIAENHRQIQKEDWENIMNEIEPLKQAIHDGIYKRLHSHDHK